LTDVSKKRKTSSQRDPAARLPPGDPLARFLAFRDQARRRLHAVVAAMHRNAGASPGDFVTILFNPADPDARVTVHTAFATDDVVHEALHDAIRGLVRGREGIAAEREGRQTQYFAARRGEEVGYLVFGTAPTFRGSVN
jgi:hypothetical protein